jgi:hypothetical protein
MLGLKKIEGGIVVALNWRYLSLSDFEHQMCKLYIGCMRSRGTRSSGAPKPWRDYCWPSKNGDTVGSQEFENIVCETIVRAYETATAGNPERDGWVLPALEHPFSDI